MHCCTHKKKQERQLLLFLWAGGHVADNLADCREKDKQDTETKIMYAETSARFRPLDLENSYLRAYRKRAHTWKKWMMYFLGN